MQTKHHFLQNGFKICRVCKKDLGFAELLIELEKYCLFDDHLNSG